MLRNWHIGLLLIPAVFAGDDAWKTKRVADWTEEETKEVLTASPWAVVVTPAVKKEEKKSRPAGIGVGIPGIGRRRQNPEPAEDPNPPTSDAPPLTLRWESALPIREAELKARETNAPEVDENHYAIAVYGLSNHFMKDPQKQGDRFKDQTSLKREGQKDLKPSHVDVLQRDDGLVIVFLFPRSKEITTGDSALEFNAIIGQYTIEQAFHVGDMIYHGKMEL